MGHHIDSEGRFQSDRYPSLPPDVVAFKISVNTANILYQLAKLYEHVDREFSEDLMARCRDVFTIRGLRP